MIDINPSIHHLRSDENTDTFFFLRILELLKKVSTEHYNAKGFRRCERFNRVLTHKKD